MHQPRFFFGVGIVAALDPLLEPFAERHGRPRTALVCALFDLALSLAVERLGFALVRPDSLPNLLSVLVVERDPVHARSAAFAKNDGHYGSLLRASHSRISLRRKRHCLPVGPNRCAGSPWPMSLGSWWGLQC